MAQSGQYNYGRCMRRGDTVAAMLALDEFVRQAISMVYLLNRTYMPYYKWMFRGMENFQILPEVAEKIRELSVMGDTSEMWKPPFPPGWNPYVNQLDPRVGRIEEICQAVVAIEIVDDTFNLSRRELVNVPLIGTVAAGAPILADENVENYFPIPAELSAALCTA